MWQFIGFSEAIEESDILLTLLVLEIGGRGERMVVPLIGTMNSEEEKDLKRKINEFLVPY